jgi:hypothetical protein
MAQRGHVVLSQLEDFRRIGRPEMNNSLNSKLPAGAFKKAHFDTENS